VERALSTVAARLGIEDLYPHRLRRTYATEYLRALGPDSEAPIKLQQHMQWASMTTAFMYVDHPRGAALDEVAVRMLKRSDMGHDHP
jgi:integrase